MASRPPLGIALADVLGASAPAHQVSKGQLIAGIIADALAGAMGRPGQFAQHMEQQQQRDQEDADWGRRLVQKQLIEQQFPDQSPMERDVAAWSHMTPEHRAAYQEMQKARAGDPDVFTTLPNGQFYSGPRSGLAAALTGGAPAPVNRPAIGTRIPLDGGPTQPASGGFRRVP
jgi:hypothetical protein